MSDAELSPKRHWQHDIFGSIKKNLIDEIIICFSKKYFKKEKEKKSN